MNTFINFYESRISQMIKVKKCEKRQLTVKASQIQSKES